MVRIGGLLLFRNRRHGRNHSFTAKACRSLFNLRPGFQSIPQIAESIDWCRPVHW
jgi:hypothetical protein